MDINDVINTQPTEAPDGRMLLLCQECLEEWDGSEKINQASVIAEGDSLCLDHWADFYLD